MMHLHRWASMVQRKRTAGSAPTRRSTRGQKAPEDEPDSHNADTIEPDPLPEEPSPTPRKRAKTGKYSGKPDPATEEGLQDEYMIDSKEPTNHATDINNDLEESDTSKTAPQTRSKLSLQTDNLNGADGEAMQDESPTTEVSQKLGSVDIETPRKQTQSTSSTKATRSKGKAVDTDMMDELSTMITTDSVRRSGRARKANPIYDEDKILDTAEKQREIPTPKPKPPRKQEAGPKTTAKGSKTGVWSSQHLLTSKRSKLINAEANLLTTLAQMIFNENTWGLFTDEEKTELLSLLHPIDTEITDPDHDPANPPPRIPTPTLFQNLNNDAFRSAFAELQDDLATGSYEPSYIKRAEEALRQRLGPMADKVDDLKNKEFEEWWGQKQAVFYGDAGAATNITLYELCRHKIFRPGDMFEYKRTFAGSKGSITVEKVCRLDSVELSEESPAARKKKEVCTMTFRYPAGTRKFLLEDHAGSSKAAGEDKNAKGHKEKDITIQVNTLAQLEFAILDEDGTVKASDPIKFKKYPSANAWKTFMVRRNDEFLGGTFVMRQDYYEKKAATFEK
ncbi:hypothetical protein Dda_5373 [Drechslerella dactyloides]|uniref:ASX DEUBAD domain-containing protein n=1 Tax=Drechslerella dactyloides TaxID=74499 RepID=A0AAD6NIS4_DREDA|nr:hypothetical protein Dda_5373 [Drechslerella dactyloides]